MSPDDKAIGMVVPDGFRLQESRPAALDSSLVKRGVLVRLSMGWFGGLITRQSQERTKHVYDYRVHLVEDQSVRSMKLTVRCIQHGPKHGGGCVGFAGAKRRRADGGCGRREQAGMSARSYRSRRRKIGSQ